MDELGEARLQREISEAWDAAHAAEVLRRRRARTRYMVSVKRSGERDMTMGVLAQVLRHLRQLDTPVERIQAAVADAYPGPADGLHENAQR